ncbi:MAG: SH3 domain-containing protein [Leptolyngbyaceae cyanobacterium bins.59]|nr:SH3 domain-containing protein [Leptolyngbyaceae cyanobacterium bins.59]
MGYKMFTRTWTQQMGLSVATVGILLLGTIAPVLARDGVLRADDPKAQINLRQSSSATSPLLGYGLVGDKVQILEQTNGSDGFVWYRVKFVGSSAVGWIRGSFVREITVKKEGILRADDVKAQINLRESTSTTSRIMGYGVVGDRVEILEQASGADGFVWYRVKFPKSGSVGWIRGTFIRVL